MSGSPMVKSTIERPWARSASTRALAAMLGDAFTADRRSANISSLMSDPPLGSIGLLHPALLACTGRDFSHDGLFGLGVTPCRGDQRFGHGLREADQTVFVTHHQIARLHYLTTDSDGYVDLARSVLVGRSEA